MDHAEIDVVRLQALQKVFERRAHVLYVSASEILTVFPGGADVALDIPVTAVVPDAFADDIPGCRVCHPAVENVDPLCGGVVDQLNALCLGVPLQPFPTEANLTDLQPGLSQSSVPHDGYSSHYICFIIPWEMRGINCKKTWRGAYPAQGSMFCFIRRCGGHRCNGRVPALREARDLDAGAGIGRMDEFTASDVHADVGSGRAAAEEDEITGNQAVIGDVVAVCELSGRGAWLML